MTPQLKRFLFNYSIESASGHQTFYVDAKNLKEAEEKIKSGGEIYAHECEVTDLSDKPEFAGETTLDDFGDFPPDGAPNESAAINRELLEALKIWARECPRCAGSGEEIVPDPFMSYQVMHQPCRACAGTRAVIAKAEGAKR